MTRARLALLGAARGSLLGAAAAGLVLWADDIRIFDRSEAFVPAASFGAAQALVLEAVTSRRTSLRALSGAGSALVAMAAASGAVRLLSGHWPWAGDWPPASFLLREDLSGLARDVALVALAFAAGQIAAGPRRAGWRRALVAATTTALFLAVPLLIWGELALLVHVLAAIPLVGLSGVFPCGSTASRSSTPSCCSRSSSSSSP